MEDSLDAEYSGYAGPSGAPCGSFFGVFSRYLAPQPHHDRCERSVGMTLYSLHKREFVIIGFGLITALTLATLIGLLGPPITWTTEFKGTNLLNGTDGSLAKGPFNIISPHLNSYHQQLWLIARIELENKDEVGSFEKEFEVEVGVYGLVGKKPIRVFYGPEVRRSRQLQCHSHSSQGKSSDCEPLTFVHLAWVDYPQYFIQVKLFDLEVIHEKYKITEVHFHIRTYNPAFTQLELCFRFIYAMTTFLVTGLFAYTLRKYSLSDWSLEQKWTAILLPLLFLYDNPAFPLQFLINSTFPGMLDALFQVTFFCGLLLFWLSIYHGLRQMERRFLFFYLPKVMIVFILWIIGLVLACWQKLSISQDPTYNYLIDTDSYHGVRNFGIGAGVVALLYLLFLVLRAYSELRTLPYFDLRLKFLTMMMMFVLKSMVMLTYMRFGMDMVEDHFVMDLNTTYPSSATFMLFYGILNFYVYTMAFVYSPTTNAFINPSSQITKDNPTFSMINDSDEEDVVYGSENEETRIIRTPKTDAKTNGGTPTATLINHNDDSD